MDKRSLNDLLKDQGYKEERNEKSVSFGDYVEQYASKVMVVRSSSSKSSEMLDVCSTSDRNNWYDVALVKALIFSETNLNKESELGKLSGFLVEKLREIEELFSPDRYQETKAELDKLEKLRVAQMFPDLP